MISGYNFEQKVGQVGECVLSLVIIVMNVVFREFLDDIWIKNEKLLCSLKYNQSSRVLKVFPDFTNTHPYTLKIQSDKERIYSYFIENCSNSIPESIETNEKTLIKNVSG